MMVSKKAIRTVQAAGSPQTGEPVFLVVGKIRRPHGVRGEVILEVHTDFPERLKPGVTLYAGDDYQPLQIRSCRPNGDTLLIAFRDSDGLDLGTPESVSDLRNRFVYVRAEDRPQLPDGEYYHHELLGINVISDEGARIGEIVEILTTGANDVYVVRPQVGPEILLPAIEPVILSIDIPQHEMRVHLIPGLIPE
jgi:16S rRNA processing protein RimM